MKMKKLIVLLTIFLSVNAIAQNNIKTCQDTLKGYYSINRISSTFLDNVCYYKQSQFIVVNRECNNLILSDTLIDFPRVVCIYTDIHYPKEIIDSLYRGIKNYLRNFKINSNELDFNFLSLERGIIFCLSVSNKFIRIIPVDECLKDRQFKRIIKRLHRNKDIKEVCFLRCDAKGFEEFNTRQ